MWKAIGDPTVRRQRDKWVVRVNGIDTETGQHRPKQLGTYPSQRAALAAARAAEREDAAASQGTVGWLVRRYVDSRTDLGPKAQHQYRWAVSRIEQELGSIRLDRLDRSDIARWLHGLAQGGELTRRSIHVCRTILKAALTDAVEEGIIRRNPAARVPLPRDVVKPNREKEVDAWTEDEVDRFLEVSSGHRWAAGFRIAILYGLRRSELLALRWDDFDPEEGRLRIDEGYVAVGSKTYWTKAKNARSRRTIPLDDQTVHMVLRHRRQQAQERLLVGPAWAHDDVILSSRTGHPVLPRSFDRTLLILIRRAELPRLSSHGLRHTAATHMVRSAADLGELRAVAEILGHSPEILLSIYAHALPDTLRAVANRIGRRASGTGIEPGRI